MDENHTTACRGSKPEKAVIVEFIGMPGSGKSTLAHALGEELRRLGVRADEPLFRGDPTGRRVRQQTARVVASLTFLLLCPRVGRMWLAEVARSRQRSPGDLRAVTLNLLSKCEMLRRCAVVPGTHVLEEGLLHALWSLGYGARGVLPGATSVRETVAAIRPFSWVLVSVRLEASILAERLRTRGHGSRMERDLATGNVLRDAARAHDGILGIVRELSGANGLAEVRLLEVENDESAQKTAAELARMLDGRL